MKLLLLLLLAPAFVMSQEVTPVTSKDYLDLINSRNLPGKNKLQIDTTNSIKNSFYDAHTNYDGQVPVRRVVIKGDKLKIKPLFKRAILIGGYFNAKVEASSISRLPAVQTQYVQGRSQNGYLIWQGPETGELFSYGPSINTLEFDNSPYVYDVNGRLILSNSAGGEKPALDLKAEIPGVYKGKASNTYLYYMPEYKHWNEGVEVIK